MKLMRSILFAGLAVLTMIACKNNSSEDAARESLATPATTATQPTQSPADAADAVPVGPLTSIEFTESEFDFGEIEEGEKVVHEFTFKNTGKEPLVISKAQGSCGCTVPDWPKEPIAVGETGVIKVQYDSRGKGKTRAEGGRAENKRVTITANTDPVQTFLNIKGKVYKPDTPAS